MWLFLRDVTIVVGILLTATFVAVGWAIIAGCALAATYLITLVMGYRGKRNETPSS